MSATKSVLRVISPQKEWSPSPKLKCKSNHQNTPLSHKTNKRAGSNYFWKSCAKENLQTNEFPFISAEGKNKLNFNSSPICDVFSPLAIQTSSYNFEKDEKCSKSSTPSSYQFSQYIPNLSISKLPLSPSMFECSLTDGQHPIQNSSDCQHESPVNGFLYTPDRSGLRLGRGSFGNVTLCKYGKQPFALKIVHCSKSTLLGERNLVGVKHAHLVSVLKVVQLIDTAYIFMDFAGHSNLQQLLDNKADISFSWRLRFAQQIITGLNHCHQLNIAHGDVKPVNIIVNPKGLCKLGDFGLSMKIGTKTNHTYNKDDGFAGTAAYAAPEVLKGKPLSLQADIYSFGITLWQLYTNETPFAGEHPHIIIYKVVSSHARPKFENPINNSVKEEYVNLSERCWDKSPEKRPSSVCILTNLTNLFTFFKTNATNKC